MTAEKDLIDQLMKEISCEMDGHTPEKKEGEPLRCSYCGAELIRRKTLWKQERKAAAAEKCECAFHKRLRRLGGEAGSFEVILLLVFCAVVWIVVWLARNLGDTVCDIEFWDGSRVIDTRCEAGRNNIYCSAGTYSSYKSMKCKRKE